MAIAVAPVFLWLVKLGGLYFFSLVMLLTLILLYEFAALVGAKGASVPVWLALPLGGAVTANFHVEFLPVQDAVLIATLALLTLELWRRQGSPLHNLGGTFLGLFYISFSFGTLLALRKAETDLGSDGYLTMALVATVWAADTFAYFGGRYLGQKMIARKFFERISPKKTWEGFFTGLLGSVLVAYFFWAYLLRTSVKQSDVLIIGALVGVFAPVGDLIESMFKRDSGLKDSSGLIPGHGGFFDRFDSLCYAAPVVYLAARLVLRLW